MVKHPELERLQGFLAQYSNDHEHIANAIEQYKQALQVAKNNYQTFLKERNKWIISNLSLFLSELPEHINVCQIEICEDFNIVIRVFTKHHYIDYDINTGWTQLQSVSNLRKGSDFDI